MFKKIPILKIVVLLFISLLSILIWFSPVLFKGYVYKLPSYKIVTARNIIQTGKFSMENEKNVVLNTSKIKSEGVVSSQGDQFIPIISSFIYRFTGLPSSEKAVFIGIIFYSLSLLFFSLTIWQLFNFETAVIFALIYIFFPTIWNLSLTSNNYEYSLLFLSIAFFILFFEKIEFKHRWIQYTISGVFFALAFLSRDPIGLIAPALLLWVWLYKRKVIIPVFVSMILTFLLVQGSIQFIYGINGNNHFVYIGAAEKKTQGKDFYFYTHLYPDPYTYHYGRGEFLSEKLSEIDGLGVKAMNARKALSNVEPDQISLWQHFIVAPNLLTKHLASLFILGNTGGPLIFLLFILGLIKLYQTKNKIAQLSIFWILSTFVLSSLVFLVGRNHVMDFAFMYALLISVGILEVSRLVAGKLFAKNNKTKQNIITIFIVLFVLYHQILISHIVFGRAYDNPTSMLIRKLAMIINSRDITNEDIIATPFRSDDIYALNYLTNKSYVKFNENTIVKLANSGKLKEAFNDFHVTKILGFDKKITDLILDHSDVANISNNNNIIIGAEEISPAKSLFLNLFR